MRKKKISIFTGTRAEYHILENLIIKLQKDRFLVDLISTGTHLSKKYGETIKDIDKKNFNSLFNISIIKKTNDRGLIDSSYNLIRKLNNIFYKSKPEILICLGDRYETFLACYVATIYKVPIVHFHGGELTQSLYDDCFRHSITKMSNLHFVSHNVYKKRVIQLGENPKYVFNIGSLAVEKIKKINFLSGKEIEKKFKIKFSKYNFLITYHPVTLRTNSYKVIENIFKAALKFKNISIIVTAPNADTESSKIIDIIKEYSKKNSNIFYVKSFGGKAYFSTAKKCNLIIGNSSSAINEIPAMGKTSINVGDRQMGRLCPSSVIQCGESTNELFLKMKKYLNQKNKIDNTFYKKNSVANAVKILKNLDYKNIKEKKFYNL